MRGDVTGLLLEWNQGKQDAREQLIRLVYEELRRIAGRSLQAERDHHTLQPTALVHEAYQKLIDQRRVQWHNRAHFYAVAAELMRRILVDYSRRHRAQRRGGGSQKLTLDENIAGDAATADVDTIALDGALTELASLDAVQARIVELRFFGGLSMEETAEVVGVSRATAFRDWEMARAWLHRRLSAS